MSTAKRHWEINYGLGLTAAAVSLARALESADPDGLINDPFARGFVEACDLGGVSVDWPEPGEAISDENSLWGSLPAYLGVRTKYFDDVMKTSTAGGIRQVVLVAAGLDSRAFRLPWPPQTVLYEIDVPPVLAFKAQVIQSANLQPQVARRTVEADLRDDWGEVLIDSGFEPTTPTVWVAEGLLAFLEPQVEADLLAAVTALSAPGSNLGLEAAPGNDRHGVLKSRFASAEERIGIPLEGNWQFDARPEPIDVLRQSGWQCKIDSVLDAAVRYRRSIPGPMGEAASYTKLVHAYTES